MTRKTVALLTTSYPESGDGSEAAGAFVGDLAEMLATKVPVRVIAPGQAERGPETIRNLEVWRFAGAGRPLSLLSAKSPSAWPQIAKVLTSMDRQTKAAVADGSVAHILALWTIPCGWIARSRARRFSTPYSVWALGSDIWTLGRLPVISKMLRLVSAEAAFCYADGLTLAADAARIGGRTFEFLPSTRRALISNPKPPATRAPWKLFFLGRWHPNKGVDLLLESLQLLPERTWENIAEVTIAGGGPLQDVVHDHVERLRSAGRPVRLRGFLDADGVGTELARADWMIVPSRIESIPVVLSDALKAGRPVVVTPVGDMERLVGGASGCGIVAGEVTAASIAEAIAKAMETGPAAYLEGVAAAAASFDLTLISERIISDMGLGRQ